MLMAWKGKGGRKTGRGREEASERMEKGEREGRETASHNTY